MYQKNDHSYHHVDGKWLTVSMLLFWVKQLSRHMFLIHISPEDHCFCEWDNTSCFLLYQLYRKFQRIIQHHTAGI